MSEEKTATRELVWLYSRKQAQLLVDSETAEVLEAVSNYHRNDSECPCNPWDWCDCPCHTAGLIPTGESASNPRT